MLSARGASACNKVQCSRWQRQGQSLGEQRGARHRRSLGAAACGLSPADLGEDTGTGPSTWLTAVLVSSISQGFMVPRVPSLEPSDLIITL